MDEFLVAADSPLAKDVQDLLAAHLEFANSHSPREDVHALDVDGLLDRSVTFFSIRSDGVLLGIGAIKDLGEEHAELKSIHTVDRARGRGVGYAMVQHLVGFARDSGFSRVSLETGSMDGFAPSRALYDGVGFTVCDPFGPYSASPNSTFMTLAL
jgi:putative acetyltransferase